MDKAVADPDLKIRGLGGGRGGHPDPDTRGEVVSKKFFSALRTLVWYKIRGGGPFPGSATVHSSMYCRPYS